MEPPISKNNRTLKELVETSHGLDLALLFLREILFRELAQPLRWNCVSLDRFGRGCESLEYMAEDAVEFVQVALIFHKCGSRQIIEILDPLAGQGFVHGLHEREIFTQRNRNAGRLKLMKEGYEHGDRA
jgi:hypothetical protein